MRVFMLGWEFPPQISGGLGTACYGLTKALDEIGVGVCFVLPTALPVSGPSGVKLRTTADLAETTSVFSHMELHHLPAVLQPYGTTETYQQALRELGDMEQQAQPPPGPQDRKGPDEAAAMKVLAGTFCTAGGENYTGDLMAEVHRYARLAVELAQSEQFDVVHAHDWMTFPAGFAVAAAMRKPLVVHIHSTEFDRAGANVNQQIYDIERAGMHGASRLICVSYMTRNIITSRYGVDPKKIDVVYNAVEAPAVDNWQMQPIRTNEKIVLFLGRLTMQKGPDYFLRAAKKVVEKFKDVRFIMAGSGDMIQRCIEQAKAMGLQRYVTFTGFLHGNDLERVFQIADLYVMPSVSEPFGIAPLEALSHNVPVIISRQSGVSEVLTHVLKVDFWDTDEIANKVLAVLRHPPLQRTLRQHGHIELHKLSWRDSALKIRKIYDALAAAGQAKSP
ncbi:MAG: glycosyltransferase [Planctomycetota bacterium]|nr:glycosyltransferase [Planctomycetota bacterium]